MSLFRHPSENENNKEIYNTNISNIQNYSEILDLDDFLNYRPTWREYGLVLIVQLITIFEYCMCQTIYIKK